MITFLHNDTHTWQLLSVCMQRWKLALIIVLPATGQTQESLTGETQTLLQYTERSHLQDQRQNLPENQTEAEACQTRYRVKESNTTKNHSIRDSVCECNKKWKKKNGEKQPPTQLEAEPWYKETERWRWIWYPSIWRENGFSFYFLFTSSTPGRNWCPSILACATFLSLLMQTDCPPVLLHGLVF